MNLHPCGSEVGLYFLWVETACMLRLTSPKRCRRAIEKAHQDDIFSPDEELMLGPQNRVLYIICPPNQGLFQSKQGSFGFQVYLYIYIHLEPIFPTFCGYITLKRMMFFRFLSKPRVIGPVPGIYTPADLAKMAREMACKCSCKWKRNDKLSQRIPYVWVFEPKYVFF